MALVIGDNFSFQGAKPLDGRLKYDTLANMKAVGDSTMYDGCLAYCVATDKTYQWKSTNTVDSTTGRWREFSGGGGGASTLNGLTDVDLSNPSNGQILKYNSTTQKWENAAESGGGGGVGSLFKIYRVDESVYGTNVTVTDGTNSVTGTFDNTGYCEIIAPFVGDVQVISNADSSVIHVNVTYFGVYDVIFEILPPISNGTYASTIGKAFELVDKGILVYKGVVWVQDSRAISGSGHNAWYSTSRNIQQLQWNTMTATGGTPGTYDVSDVYKLIIDGGRYHTKNTVEGYPIWHIGSNTENTNWNIDPIREPSTVTVPQSTTNPDYWIAFFTEA